MFESFKETWKEIQQDQPGKRFRRQYRRRQAERKGIVKKVLFVGGGLFIVLAGFFFLPAPGPGTLIIFIGLGLIAQESLWMAVFLDKLELRLRRLYKRGMRTWNGTSALSKFFLIAGSVIIGALALYAAYVIFYG